MHPHAIVRRRPRAFTLIELLIVVAIIAILAAIAVPNFVEAQTRAKSSRVVADMRSIITGLESYAVDHNAYPPTILDGRQNVMTMMTGVMPFVPFTLSTPIAYMTDVPLDTFKPRVMHDHKHSFMYFNPTNTPDDTMRRNYRGVVESVPMMAWESVRVPMYFMVSTGPDLAFGVMGQQTGLVDPLVPEYALMVNAGMMSMPSMGSPLLYDPTNGSAGEGDIVRFGP